MQCQVQLISALGSRTSFAGWEAVPVLSEIRDRWPRAYLELLDGEVVADLVSNLRGCKEWPAGDDHPIATAVEYGREPLQVDSLSTTVIRTGYGLGCPILYTDNLVVKGS